MLALPSEAVQRMVYGVAVNSCSPPFGRTRATVGAPGGDGCVVAVAAFEYGESAPSLIARTRYAYVAEGSSPLSAYSVASAPTVAIGSQLPDTPVFRAIENPVSLPALSVQVRSIRLLETTSAVRSVGD